MPFSSGTFSLVAGPVSATSVPLACAAGSHSPSFSFKDIDIISAKRVPSFAMSLCALLFGGSLNHLRGRTVSNFDFFKNRNLWRYPSFEAFFNNVCANSCISGPICRDHPDAFKLNPYVRGTIAVLIVARIPFAVLWRVVTVVIDALKPVSIRAGSKIGLEISKPLSCWLLNKPSIGYLNSSATVPMKLRGSRAIATTEHVLIQVIKLLIFPRSSHAI